MRLLLDREVDAVVFPYVDMLLAAHHWPQNSEDNLRGQLSPVVAQLKNAGFVEIIEREHYAVIRLDDELAKLQEDDQKSKIYDFFCLTPKCLRIDRFDEQTPSAVGALKGGVLYSQGESGFIIFGPYEPMDSGEYSLVVKGQVTHGKWEISGKNVKAGVLLSTTVKIDEPVRDIELRVYVREADQITISGYALQPASSSSSFTP